MSNDGLYDYVTSIVPSATGRIDSIETSGNNGEEDVARWRRQDRHDYTMLMAYFHGSDSVSWTDKFRHSGMRYEADWDKLHGRDRRRMKFIIKKAGRTYDEIVGACNEWERADGYVIAHGWFGKRWFDNHRDEFMWKDEFVDIIPNEYEPGRLGTLVLKAPRQ